MWIGRISQNLSYFLTISFNPHAIGITEKLLWESYIDLIQKVITKHIGCFRWENCWSLERYVRRVVDWLAATEKKRRGTSGVNKTLTPLRLGQNNGWIKVGSPGWERGDANKLGHARIHFELINYHALAVMWMTMPMARQAINKQAGSEPCIYRRNVHTSRIDAEVWNQTLNTLYKTVIVSCLYDYENGMLHVCKWQRFIARTGL